MYDGTKGKSSSFTFDPGEFAAMGQRCIEELGSVQSELLEKFQEANRQWLDRLQAEANVSADFGSRLMRAGSIPEAMTIFQEWTNRGLEMMAEDGKHLLDDTQKFIEAGTRLANAWQSKGPGGGT